MRKAEGYSGAPPDNSSASRRSLPRVGTTVKLGLAIRALLDTKTRWYALTCRSAHSFGTH
ncbi:hypothetical protein FHS96_005487 [Sphingomonas zeicaulis]|uniref:hypothetical protein n=1 Tax=Sphingomonas zeicaulis TaxID=1632740 RepID=UPI003D20B9C6